MSQDSPLKVLFRMRPELERDVLRFTTGEDLPYATALGWVLQAAEIAHAALDVERARVIRGSDTEKRLADALATIETLERSGRETYAALESKTAALALALQERDSARAKLFGRVLETSANVVTASGPVPVILPVMSGVPVPVVHPWSPPYNPPVSQ